ncbi:MAG: DUF4115 domain-containing protein [Zoogloeaceae bacterium]|jgi:cytoskeleton protein RodZ|nr:DUF4115 domain-containing protein [Zoogloeaceae bacterium]
MNASALSAPADAAEEPRSAADENPAREVGRLLTARREERRLSRPEAAASLRLSERQIAALEEGDLASLPGRTFVRGFARNYARLLDMPHEPLLALLDKEQGLTAPLPQRSASTRVLMPRRRQENGQRDRLLVGLGIFCLVAAIVAVIVLPDDLRFEEGGWFDAGQDSSGAVLKEEGETRADAVREEIIALPSPESAADASAAKIPASEVSSGGAPEASGKIQAAQGAPAPSAPPVLSNAQRLTLTFEFLEESWIEVKSKDGQVLISRLHEAGGTRAVEVTLPVSVVIGRASRVRLSYLGRQVPLSPNRQDVAVVHLP